MIVHILWLACPLPESHPVHRVHQSLLVIITTLYIQAMWLLKLARQDEAAAQKAFASIPDFIVRDMTAWLGFVIRYGQPDLVASCRLDVLIAFMVEMLQRGELVQSPIIHAKIVELLLTMLSPQLGRHRGRGVPMTVLSLMHACMHTDALLSPLTYACRRYCGS